MSEPTSSSRSLIQLLVGIIIVLGCLVLAGLGVGGYFLIASPPESAEEESPTPSAPAQTETPTLTPTASPTPTETPVPTTAVLQSAADSWISDDPGSAPAARASVLYLGSKAGFHGRALFRFDLSGIPAGATVLTATFEAYLADITAAPPTMDVQLWRLDTMWEEATVRWNTPLNYTDTGAVTSVERTQGYYPWTITGLVQSWVSGTPNYGVILISATESTAGALGFSSRESSNPPRLTVVYLP